MKTARKLMALTATLALGALPALGLAAPGGGNSHPTGKAYGKYCQGESKQHVKGQKGTPFSNCVADMAKLASGKAANPTSACKNESKKHVKGQKGTPYSLCVSGAAKLQKTLKGGGSTTTTTTSTTTT